MDFSQQELPITAFFSRAVKKKKDDRPLTRYATKRKRHSLEAQQAQATQEGDRIGASSSTNERSLDIVAPTKSKFISGSSRTLTVSGKRLQVLIDETPSPEVIDLTSSSPGSKTNAKLGPSKRRRVDVPAHGVRLALATPPSSTRGRKPDHFHLSTLTAKARPIARGVLPTPATSVPRRPSHLGRVAVPHAPTSPLESRTTVPNNELPWSSPLSSCPSDDPHDDNGGKSHADVAQALLDVAPVRRNADVANLFRAREVETSGGDDPFAAPPEGNILVPSSPSPSITDMPPPSTTPTRRSGFELSTVTSPFLAPALSNRTTNVLHHAPQSVVESSQSQFLLPFKDSPRRRKMMPEFVVTSSQSQILLPFFDSPRRQQRIFTPAARDIDLQDENEIVPTSQGQLEDEMYLGMDVLQFELHAMPTFNESVSQNAESQDGNMEAGIGSSLPESFPRTPPNKRASRWRELHLGSSPLSTPCRSSPARLPRQAFPISPQKWPPHSVERNPVKNVNVLPESEIPSFPARRGFLRSQTASNEDSITTSVLDSALHHRTPGKRGVHLRDLLSFSPSGAEVDYDFGGVVENSLVSQSTSHVWLRSKQTYNSGEDTQALFLAGAPLQASQFSARIHGAGDSTQSVSSVVRNFIDMFDDDDGSYPADFPEELRC